MKKWWFIIVGIIGLAVLAVPFLVIGGDPGPDIESGMTPEEIEEAMKEYEDANRPQSDADPSGVFFCSIKSRDDVFQGNMFRMEVKIDQGWPGIEIDVAHNVAKERVETVWVKIRGVDVSGMHEYQQPDYPNEHHTRIARHRKRHAESSHFAWDILNRVEMKWLTNPERVVGTPYITCDLFLEIANATILFRDFLIDEGYGLPIEDEGDRWDWGRRIPQKRRG